jgi:TonB family protein
MSPLSVFVSEDDFPVAAIRSGVQGGTVYFRLSIGTDGRVQGCAVTRSSGYDLLDSTTCRLMVRRARFTPATDPQGRPRTDEFDGYIEWRAPEPRLPWGPLPERPGAAVDLWSQCTWGEGARLALSSLEPAAIAERAIRACTELEAQAARELSASAATRANAPRYIRTRKRDFLFMLTPYLERVRRVLGAAQAK